MNEPYRGKDYETMQAWVKNNIGYIQINRPQAMNAFNVQLCYDAQDILNGYKYEPEVHVIIILGHDSVFGAGADLSYIQDLNAFEARDFLDITHSTIFAITENHKPTIAAVRGICLGAGFETMLACDIRVVAEDAMFGLPEIRLGLIPGGSGTLIFPREANLCLAKEYMLTGDMFGAAEAYRMGIVNHVVPADEVMPKAEKIAKKLASKSTLALREAKAQVNMAQSMSFRDGCAMEQLRWSLLFADRDHSEGINAFLENRKPKFENR